MRQYSVTVADHTCSFVALDDGYAFDAVTDILQRKTFRGLQDYEIFQIDGPDGPLKSGNGTLGDIRAF